MIPVDELLNRLGYDKSPHYHRLTEDWLKSETAHLFRAARDAGTEGKSSVDGIYVFRTSPPSDPELLPERPAVYIAEASDTDEARQIHRKLWNLSYAPFIIVRLPHQIRIYTGFNYSPDEPKKKEEGLLETVGDSGSLDLLTKFTAESIDSGHIWEAYAEELNPNQRVDKHLLKNLEILGNALKEDGLRDEIAHALIGKYVYLSYLRDRNILTEPWLAEQQIDADKVFSLNATVSGLKKLSEALENRVNGKIFPIDFDKEDTLKDEHVSWVASIFSGAEIIDVNTTPKIVRQLHLPFKAYDFHYIPVETFSAIYEQFIYDRKKKGAVYTPEVLADYLLSEVEWAKPLKPGTKILDPACGSGVFLVLAYRRLIEQELKRQGQQKLSPERLGDILLESIFGVERERDACYVTEFSLILTLLHYAEPRALEKLDFQFPDLHNQQIFECDFFDLEGKEGEAKFWQQGLAFDWIVGNPPWISSKQTGEFFTDTWIQKAENKTERPVGTNSIAEAFSWLVTDLLNPKGIVGLVLPATSLVNRNSQKYREAFFTKNIVLRITNFANLRDVLFDGRTTSPAATFIYQPSIDADDPPPIIHYGPFSVNQVAGAKDKLWVIIVNESEIQTISQYEAEGGETFLWKSALWGTHLDKRAIERIRYLFPFTLNELCGIRNWHFQEASQLRHRDSGEKLIYVSEIKDYKRFDTASMKRSVLRFSIQQNILKDIPDEMCYIREQGGKKGLNVTQAPHIILSPSWQQYITYSNKHFVIPSRQIGIASPEKKDAAYLKALSIYLNSSLVAYYLFFHTQEWGIFRQARRITTTEVRKIPTPDLMPLQVKELATLHDELVKSEKQEILKFVSKTYGEQTRFDLEGSLDKEDFDELGMFANLTANQKKDVKAHVREKLQQRIDEKIFSLFDIPEDIQLLVSEFFQTRLPLDTPSAREKATKRPTEPQLLVHLGINKPKVKRPEPYPCKSI